MPPPFVPGVDLASRLYTGAVAPLLREHDPLLRHSAALLGPGSEVLGFDAARSTDHDWGPRLLLFLRGGDLSAHGEALDALFATCLPATVAGYSTNLEPAAATGTRHLRPASGPVAHGIVIAEPRSWLTGQLGFDPLAAIDTFDWLATSTQALAEVTGGAVFHDGLRILGRARRRLAWYPDDVWRYVLACQWRRIAQEEAFVGRCGEAGDELGSAVVAARLTRDLMRLCLLMARVYPPYGKWLGSAFVRLPVAARLTAPLRAALAARGWRGRERHLTAAYETVAGLHNALGLTDPLDPRVRAFHTRPYQVLAADRFAVALAATITDPVLRARPLTGALDQFADSTDVVSHRARGRVVIGALHNPRG
jgi:hypothetical protein